MLVFAAIVPHPPESIPGIGSDYDRKVIQKTLDAFETLRKDLEKAKPDTVIIISPHARMDPYSFAVNADSELKGSLENFGVDDFFEYKNDFELADKIAYDASMNDLPAHLHATFLDYGALIPLYHLLKNINPKVVHLSFSLMDYKRHYRYGEIIRLASEVKNPARIAIIASGALSHKLTPAAPAGYSQTAQVFDQNIIHLLGENDMASILGMHEEFAIEAAECGMRSIIIVLGALHGKPYKFKLLSYEGPFGIGYLVARLL